MEPAWVEPGWLVARVTSASGPPVAVVIISSGIALVVMSSLGEVSSNAASVDATETGMGVAFCRWVVDVGGVAVWTGVLLL